MFFTAVLLAGALTLKDITNDVTSLSFGKKAEGEGDEVDLETLLEKLEDDPPETKMVVILTFTDAYDNAAKEKITDIIWSQCDDCELLLESTGDKLVVLNSYDTYNELNVDEELPPEAFTPAATEPVAEPAAVDEPKAVGEGEGDPKPDEPAAEPVEEPAAQPTGDET